MNHICNKQFGHQFLVKKPIFETKVFNFRLIKQSLYVRTTYIFTKLFINVFNNICVNLTRYQLLTYNLLLTLKCLYLYICTIDRFYYIIIDHDEKNGCKQIFSIVVFNFIVCHFLIICFIDVAYLTYCLYYIFNSSKINFKQCWKIFIYAQLMSKG